MQSYFPGGHTYNKKYSLCLEIPKAVTPESHMWRLKKKKRKGVFSLFLISTPTLLVLCGLSSSNSTCINAFLLYSLLYARPTQAFIHLCISQTGPLLALKKDMEQKKIINLLSLVLPLRSYGQNLVLEERPRFFLFGCSVFGFVCCSLTRSLFILRPKSCHFQTYLYLPRACFSC